MDRESGRSRGFGFVRYHERRDAEVEIIEKQTFLTETQPDYATGIRAIFIDPEDRTDNRAALELERLSDYSGAANKRVFERGLERELVASVLCRYFFCVLYISPLRVRIGKFWFLN